MTRVGSGAMGCDLLAVVGMVGAPDLAAARAVSAASEARRGEATRRRAGPCRRSAWSRARAPPPAPRRCQRVMRKLDVRARGGV
eukprot:3938255-Rhodomonas_salina.1